MAGQIEAVAGRTWIVAAIEMTHRDKAKLSQCGLASQMAVIVATPSITLIMLAREIKRVRRYR